MTPRPIRPEYPLDVIQEWIAAGPPRQVISKQAREEARRLRFLPSDIVHCISLLTDGWDGAGRGNYVKTALYPDRQDPRAPRVPMDVYYLDYEGYELYIKVLLTKTAAVVISFHERN